MSAVRRKESNRCTQSWRPVASSTARHRERSIDVEKLPGEVGEQITLDQVLLIVDGENVTVGRPTVAGATVTATVVGQRRHRKVLYFHYVPKKRERKRHGHRQPYTCLRIDSIQA